MERRRPPIGDHLLLLVQELRVDRVLGALIGRAKLTGARTFQLQVGRLLVELFGVGRLDARERRIDGGQILDAIAGQIQTDQAGQVLWSNWRLIGGQIAERQAVAGEIQVDQIGETGEHLAVQMPNDVVAEIETLKILEMRESVYADLPDAVAGEHQMLERVEAFERVSCDIGDFIAAQI